MCPSALLFKSFTYMKTTFKQSGSVAIDPHKMDTRDLIEGYYMLVACATLLRQAFGIVGLTNTLLESPLTESELKSFANQFDLVHKTVNSIAQGLKTYIDGRSVNVRTPNSAS